MPARPFTRRHAAAALLAVPVVIGAGLRAQPVAARRLTPAQTEGPFYPVRLPIDTDGDLLHNGRLTYSRGLPAWLDGSVRDLDGHPVAGAQVEIWQCDEAGHYHHPGDGNRADPAFQGFGRVAVGRDGSYRFHTIRPVPYSGRTPHIHVKVKLGARELLTTQLYVAGDPHNERDGLWRQLSPADREALTMPFVRAADGWRTTFPIVVEA
jgi:protocatechuate 3,4-dioxygenase beta subunit